MEILVDGLETTTVEVDTQFMSYWVAYDETVIFP
jgi:hypothetical protein